MNEKCSHGMITAYPSNNPQRPGFAICGVCNARLEDHAEVARLKEELAAAALYLDFDAAKARKHFVSVGELSTDRDLLIADGKAMREVAKSLAEFVYHHAKLSASDLDSYTLLSEALGNNLVAHDKLYHDKGWS